jgi:histidinol-phosphate aminotransferase
MHIAVSETGSGPKIRAAIDGLPPYSAGRSVRDAAGEGAVLELLGLAANEGPYGPFPSAARAALDQVGRANLYPESGFRTLRAELADMLGVDIAEVAVGAGGIGLIHHLSVALLDEGTNIVVSTPTFHAYALDARKQGATTLSTPVRKDGSYDLVTMLGLISEATRIVYVCNPNNPTGGIVSREELLSFIASVPEHVTIAERDFERRNLVTLRTFSKAYGLAGLRVAYLVGSPEIIGAVQKVQSNYEVSNVAQAAALASLREYKELERRVGLNEHGRSELTTGLRSLGFEPLVSQRSDHRGDPGTG